MYLVVHHWQDGSVLVCGEESGDCVVNLYAETPLERDPCCWVWDKRKLEFSIEDNEGHVITQEFEANLEWSVLCADTSDLDDDCE